MTRPAVSIVVPHHGDPGPTAALLGDLAGSVAELIVVDDASPVPFPETPGVTVVRREANGGFGAAVNSGAALATGELLLILNSDLRVPDGFVAELVAAAAPWQPCVAGPRLVDVMGVADPSARDFPAIRHQVAEWLTPLARWRDTDAWHRAVGHVVAAHDALTVVPVDWLVGAALLVPLAEFRAVGGFDERFFMNSEEVDLQRRLRQRGLPSVFVPTVRAVHVGGGSSDPTQRRAWVVTSRLRYADKWGGLIPLRLGMAAATGVNLAWNSVRRLRGVPVKPWETARQEWALTWRSVR